MYRLGYVDESDGDTLYFYNRFIKQYENTYELVEINPLNYDSLDFLIDDILKMNLDILVVDYRLNEYECISYQGTDLIDEVKSVKRDFPCVILTSNAEEAIENSSDVNIVYPKPLLANDDKGKALFELKIKHSIELYKGKIADAEKQIQELFDKAGDLSLEEEERICYLDDFLESNTNNRNKVPLHIKKEQHIDNIKKLVEKTQLIIDKLNG